MNKNEQDYFFSLDNSLRYLVRYITLHGGLVVAIRFRYLGQEYSADTPEEAIKLETLLRLTAEKRARTDPEFARKLAQEESGWTRDKFQRLRAGLGELQARLLVRIWQHEVMDDKDLQKELKMPSKAAFAGVLSGLSKQIRPLGIRPNDILNIDVRWSDKKKTRWFSLQPGFQAIAEEEGFMDSFLDDEELDKK